MFQYAKGESARSPASILIFFLFSTNKMQKFSAAIALCGLLFAANLATAGHGDGLLAFTYPVGGGPITVTACGGDVPAAGL